MDISHGIRLLPSKREVVPEELCHEGYTHRDRRTEEIGLFDYIL
ncbi:hypothetical protein [Methanochimaera problematica]|nr:hypothetical protein [Methanoplanus sp. FWC-SCC4]